MDERNWNPSSSEARSSSGVNGNGDERNADSREHDASQFLQDKLSDLNVVIRDRMDRSPYATLGIAVGLGFLLGRIPRRLLVVLLGASARAVGPMVLGNLVRRVSGEAAQPAE